jgi:hypothetical protein
MTTANVSKKPKEITTGDGSKAKKVEKKKRGNRQYYWNWFINHKKEITHNKINL